VLLLPATRLGPEAEVLGMGGVEQGVLLVASRRLARCSVERLGERGLSTQLRLAHEVALRDPERLPERDIHRLTQDRLDPVVGRPTRQLLRSWLVELKLGDGLAQEALAIAERVG